jgi:hypothetical protein
MITKPNFLQSCLAKVGAKESGEWERAFLMFTVFKGPTGAADVGMRNHLQGTTVGA